MFEDERQRKVTSGEAIMATLGRDSYLEHEYDQGSTLADNQLKEPTTIKKDHTTISVKTENQNH
jgi:hypothetical protein